jgi:myo-inositol-1(or 4)-monophosphatase
MSDHGLDQRHAFLRTVATEAGALARKHFENRDATAFKFKGPQDYITEADTAVEQLITGRIAEAFPTDTFFGEEGGGRFSESVWVIDPIDGTANFARNNPHFCVSIAFLHDGKPTLGAIANPMAGELYIARRGAGAWANDRRMQVSTTTDIKRAVVELGWSTRLPNSTYAAMVERVLDAGASFRRAGSGALGLADVALGRTDGYCELHINSWDCLAGILLIEEAGGWVNDFFANDGLARGNALLAATPGIRDALAQLTGIGR